MIQQLRYIYNIYPYMMDWILYIQYRLYFDDDLVWSIVIVGISACILWVILKWAYFSPL